MTNHTLISAYIRSLGKCNRLQAFQGPVYMRAVRQRYRFLDEITRRLASGVRFDAR